MAKKIDLSGVKEFLFNHGEKVALGVCAFIAIVLGGLKLYCASSAATAEGTHLTWAQVYEEETKRIRRQELEVKKPVIDSSGAKPDDLRWPFFESGYVPSKYMEVPELQDDKRRNPVALTIPTDPDTPDRRIADPKSIRIDYNRSLIFVHDYDPQARTVKGVVPEGGANPIVPPPQVGKGKGQVVPAVVPDYLKAGRAQSFVVVHAVFPMKQQVEEFRKAFKLLNQEEMFKNREDLPRILGINVVRFELTTIGGELVSKEPEIIVQSEPGGRIKMQPALEKLLREAMYDETSPPVLEGFLYEGLAMPLPRLAYGRYPKFDFPRWDLAWEDDPDPKNVGPGGGKEVGPRKDGPGTKQLPGGGKKQPLPQPMPQPMPGGGNVGADLKIETIKDRTLRDADPTLSARLFGKLDDFNVFHVLGQKAPKLDDEEKKLPGVIGPGMANANAAKYFSAWDIDPPEAAAPGVKPQPGKLPPRGEQPKGGAGQPPAVYPPWERDALIRFIDADVKPGKTYSYAIQVRIANPNFGKDKLVAAAFLANAAELQGIDSWVTTPAITIPHDYFLYAVDQPQIDDWNNPNPPKKGAAEPKLPKDATTFQIHQWVKEKVDLRKQDTYVIGDWAIVERQVVRKGERIGVAETVAVPVWRDIKDAFEVPMVPDVKKKEEKPGMRIVLKVNESEAPVLVDFTGGRRFKGFTLEEETAVEALVLMPDGKLRIHNSRDDTEALQAEAQIEGQPYRAVSRQERVLMSQRRLRDFLGGGAPKDGVKVPGPGGGS